MGNKSLTAAAVKRDLRLHCNEEKAAFFPRFFKSGKGEYAEGDKFLGVVVPDQRRVAKKYRELPLDQINKLLTDPYHECRLTGLFVLVARYERAEDRCRQVLVDFYLANLDHVNNWDLVDSSAHKILGDWLLDKPRTILFTLADSGHLWRQRVSVIACLTLIKQGEYKEIKRLAKQFLTHEHDLIHKAVGWMLREMGKMDEGELIRFLDRHTAKMPRTMLRYAIEKLPADVRRDYLAN
tara:strand:+ start:57466 stop:58179 length:714 start_codon:yes stop_codon:yes gene_type:complete